MTIPEAFLLGMMVAWTPSMVIFAWCLLRAPTLELENAKGDASKNPA
jgi:hypothetical protein